MSRFGSLARGAVAIKNCTGPGANRHQKTSMCADDRIFFTLRNCAIAIENCMSALHLETGAFSQAARRPWRFVLPANRSLT